jgi:hypothetical protein
MDDQGVLVASGDACPACLALEGTDAQPPIHPNCLCQVVPRTSDCDVDYSFSGYHYGPGEYDGGAGGEITVTCPDGSTISESFEVAFAPFAGSGADPMDIAVDGFEGEAEGLCDQCPEEEPFRCC